MYGETVVVNPEDLKRGSHYICDFRCLNCNALFRKEVRNAHEKHRCSSFRNNRTEKWCFKCESWLKVEHFHISKHTYGGFSKVCRSCRANYMVAAEIKRRQKRQHEYTPSLKELSIRKATSICAAAQVRAKKQNLNYDLDPIYIQNLWKAQEAKCWYSDIDMQISQHRVGFYSPSLDRMDPDLGYIKGNVVFCLFAVNSFKQELAYADFIQFIGRVKWRSNIDDRPI